MKIKLEAKNIQRVENQKVTMKGGDTEFLHKITFTQWLKQKAVFIDVFGHLRAAECNTDMNMLHRTQFINTKHFYSGFFPLNFII